MPSRVQVVFWSSTIVAVVLLGATWTLAHRVGVGGASVEDGVLLTIASLGLAAASLIAARIVFVIGRLRRHVRQDTRRQIRP